MQNKKTALFLFSNPEGMAPLATTLIKHGWEIHAAVENVNFLESNGIGRENLHPLLWNNPNSFIFPSQNTILGISTKKEEDQSVLEKYKIPRIDLVCADFHEKAQTEGDGLENTETLQSAKAFLIAAAIYANKIAICKISDRKDVAVWIEKEMPNEANFMLRLKGTAAILISQDFMNIGTKYDHLRK